MTNPVGVQAVGGQAVIEGVMMQSPHSLAVVCRRPDGSVVIKEDEWRPLWGSLHFLRLPVIRGGIVLLESLLHGLCAQKFSTRQQRVAETPVSEANLATRPSAWLVGMIAFGLLFAAVLFIGAPHLAAWGLVYVLGLDPNSIPFHALDGLVKLTLLVGYMAVLSRQTDVQRVRQYHGAEHKAIFTYEQGLALTVANARPMSRFHPRCGTSFLLVLIMVSTAMFSATLSTQISPVATLDHLVKFAIKIALMAPLAGLSYELIRLAGKHSDTSRLARVLSIPGMLLQRFTTREPDDAQLEIALIAIRKTLWREQQLHAGSRPVIGHYEVFVSSAEIDLPLVA